MASPVPYATGLEYRGLPEYADGRYFELDPGRHGEDATFKAEAALSLLLPTARQRGWRIGSYADVGCGSGVAVHAVLHGLRSDGFPVEQAWGFDVYPEVERLGSDAGVKFLCRDFTAAGVRADLVTLFDVFEHVPDSVGFLRAVSEQCRYLAMHIPLDNTANHGLRDRFGAKLRNPGHLVFLDAAQALSLVSYAGLRVVEYRYTPVFRAPSGGMSWKARLARAPRAAMYRLSPWLLSKTMGGCSLMVLAETRSGWGSGS